MISRSQWICLTLLLLADFALGALSASQLPDQVPVHWNFRGEIDRYGSPWEVAFLLPGIIAAATGLLILLPKLGQSGVQLARSGRAYGRMVVAIVIVLIAIHVLLVIRGSHAFDFPSAVLAVLGVLIAATGNWMGKIRRNAFAGIRTPWTLKSDEVWERTNRLGGRMMVAFGILVAAAASFLPFWIVIAALMTGLFALVIWSLVYSWSLSRLIS
jgi:uncharacterized membrane protein